MLALENVQAAGPINGTALEPVRNKEFAKAMGRALRVTSFLTTPAFALRVMLGKVAQVVTTGQRVLPKRAEKLGYDFKFPHIDEALRDALA
jgi:NAD dependent epimerase/dehydratase family enzyme